MVSVVERTTKFHCSNRTNVTRSFLLYYFTQWTLLDCTYLKIGGWNNEIQIFPRRLKLYGHIRWEKCVYYIILLYLLKKELFSENVLYKILT